MGNGALPNGPSYRAHPRLYLLRHGEAASECPLLVEEQTRDRPNSYDYRV